MDNFTSTGVLTRPIDDSILKICIENNYSSLVFQTIYIYNWDSGDPVLVSQKNYFVYNCGNICIDFPLVLNAYDESYVINNYEVVYGPNHPCISVDISTY